MSHRKIAILVSKYHGAVSWDVKRNKGLGGYRSKQAQEKAKEGLQDKHRFIKLTTEVQVLISEKHLSGVEPRSDTRPSKKGRVIHLVPPSFMGDYPGNCSFVVFGGKVWEVDTFVEKYQLPQFVWLRAWCSLEQIACEISNADICLGVFGGAEKAARVLPFKLYMYLAAGRAVITQALLSVPESTPFPPVLTVAPVNAKSLADVILKLADDVEFRCKLAQESKVYFREWLSNARVFNAWANDIAPRFSER